MVTKEKEEQDVFYAEVMEVLGRTGVFGEVNQVLCKIIKNNHR